MLTAHGVFASEPLRVLDLYAGSGALGFEALSRGASSVVFVESARPAIQAIRENAEALAVNDQVTLLATRVDKALVSLLRGDDVTFDSKVPTTSFDLVLLDPPYEDVRAEAFVETLENAARLLAAAGIFVLEHSSKDEPLVPGLTLDRRRQHSDTTLSLFVRSAREGQREEGSDDEDTHG